MSTFAVENGMELSPMGSPTIRKYPWFSMNVGQSFFVPTEADQEKSIRASIYNSGRHSIKMRAISAGWPASTVEGRPACVSIRRVTKDGVEGLRAWLSVRNENGEIVTGS